MTLQQSADPIDPIAYDQLTARVMSGATDTNHLIDLIASNHSDQQFAHTFDGYASYLATQKNWQVLETIIRQLGRLPRAPRYQVTRFLWDRHGIRELVEYYPVQRSGADIGATIFGMVTDDDMLDYQGVDSAIECFSAFAENYNELRITRALLAHISQIYEINTGYTYSDVRLAPSLSRFDYMIVCFGVMVKVIRFTHNTSYEQCARVFWQGIGVVYSTLFHIRETARSDLTNPANNYALAHTKHMLVTLGQYITILGCTYVDTLICQTIKYAIRTKRYGDLLRCVAQFSMRASIEFDPCIVCDIIARLIGSRVPMHIKYDSIRLLVSHGMVARYTAIHENHPITKQYILEYSRQPNMPVFHLLDLVDAMHGCEQIFDAEVIEQYMLGFTPIVDRYNQLIQLYVPDRSNRAVRDDLDLVYGSAIKLFDASTRLARYLKCHITPIIEYAGHLIEMGNIILPVCSKYSRQLAESVARLVGMAGKIMVTRATYTVLQGIVDMASGEYTVRIYDDNVDMARGYEVKLCDERERVDPDDLLDAISCDLVTDPYYIKSSDQLHLVDRKTILRLCETKKNPFTREPLDRESVEQFNTSPCMIEARVQIQAKLDRLYDWL